MEVLLNALLKIVEYLLGLQSSKHEPKRKLCRDLTRLYLATESFGQSLHDLIVLLEQRIEPFLVFHYDSTLNHNHQSFDGRDLQNFRSRLSVTDETYAEQVANLYNRLNSLRDEIIGLVGEVIPVKKLSIFFPQIEHAVWSLVFVDWAGGSTEQIESMPLNEMIETFGHRRKQRISVPWFLQQKNDDWSFHARLMTVINSPDNSKWKQYLQELMWSDEQIASTLLQLKYIIQQNCDVVDVV